MTETLTNPLLEFEDIAQKARFEMRDSVRLHFLFQIVGEVEWRDASYSIDGEIVGGPQKCDRPDDEFEPYVLPDISLPEGDEYGTRHPFRLSLEPTTHQLPNGMSILMRYVAVHREDIGCLGINENTFVSSQI